MEKRLYLGIDFGTTNSVIAFGRKAARTERIVPITHKVKMRGAMTDQEIVPSAAMYRKGDRKCLGIGLEVLEMLKYPNPSNEDLVGIKSVKMQLGEKSVKNAEWLKPEEVASDIIRFLKKSCENKYNKDNIENAIIGIPANFPPDKCEKTVQAGLLAGFSKVDLIAEPKAALLNFLNIESEFSDDGRIIDIDFSTPKNVLIFDIGGGTLDVNIAEVSQTYHTSGFSKKIPEISYRELGLSRYSTVGGDLFDQYLANFLLDKFKIQSDGIDIRNITNKAKKDTAVNTINIFAEIAKTQLTGEVEHLMAYHDLSVLEAMNKAEHRIIVANLLSLPNVGNLSFNYNLTYLDYVKAIEPLLGLDYDLNDFKNSQSLFSILQEDESSIITPIFDALHQAQQSLGYLPNIDLILINGGMGRLNILKERLRILFDVEKVYEISNPDLSVAHGAVVHNYNVSHNLDRSNNILPESIYLMGANNTFFPLVDAGTVYPTIKPIVHSRVFTIPQTNLSHINLPLYRGKNGDKHSIIDRVVQLNEKSAYISEGDEIDIQVKVDSNRSLHFEAWLHHKPKIRFDVSIKI